MKGKEKRNVVEPEIIGHRGYVGKYPQNTIPAFLNALKAGVEAIEMDVVISADKQVVVSHEPYMAEYMLTPDRKSISSGRARSLNLYKMDYEKIKRFEAGFGINKKYPEKKRIKTYKPLLEEVIRSVENYSLERALKPTVYYIEIKSSPKQYGTFQPHPPEFVELVLGILKEKEIMDRVIVQSFDPCVLNLLHEKAPALKVSFLVNKEGLEEQLSKLTFTPDVYSPDYKLVTANDFVQKVKSKEMKLVPWTVNSGRSLRRMRDLQVDGIITDYPQKARTVLK